MAMYFSLSTMFFGGGENLLVLLVFLPFVTTNTITSHQLHSPQSSAADKKRIFDFLLTCVGSWKPLLPFSTGILSTSKPTSLCLVQCVFSKRCGCVCAQASVQFYKMKQPKNNKIGKYSKCWFAERHEFSFIIEFLEKNIFIFILHEF